MNILQLVFVVISDKSQKVKSFFKVASSNPVLLNQV